MSAYANIVDLWFAQLTDATDVGSERFGYVAVKTATDEAFIEQRFAVPAAEADDLLTWFERQPPGDRYFSPRIFNGPRANATALPSRYLYADLDHDNLDTEEWTPYWLWETSYRSEQAIWKFDKVFDPAEHAAHNKWLTYELKADLGGWHGSKLLRIPGSLNWKRQVRHEHTLTIPIGIEHKHDPFTLNDHRKLGKLISIDTSTNGPVPALIHRDEWNQYVAGRWPELSLSVRATLETGVVKDRSRFLWRYYMACKETEVPQEVAFQLAWPMPWNKFTNPSDLWADMSKAWGA